ncbi:MAG TPA: hypothetical protein VIL65_10345 [Beijerinckiaceae bacterium]|jgi:ElaB/YqjD/DUF883 family membrane-anchored ribosome-binding protein
MDDTKKTGASTPGQTSSGSDTLSAAKISAGTSVGDVGRTAMPHETSKPTQSATLASHTSKPLGGNAGSTGAGTAGQTQGSQNNEFGRHVGQAGGGAGHASGSSSGSDQAKSATESVRQAADQAQERAGELYEQATDWAREKYEDVSAWASEQSRQAPRYADQASTYSRRTGSSVTRFVAENPVMVGVVGLAAGLLLGALLPRTRREEEVLGEWADEVREQGMRYAQSLTEEGRRYAQSLTEEGMRYAHEAAQRGREIVEGAGGDEASGLGGQEGNRPDEGAIRPGNRYQSH